MSDPHASAADRPRTPGPSAGNPHVSAGEHPDASAAHEESSLSTSGRAAEHDLGAGHTFAWLHGQGGVLLGLIEHHPDLRVPAGQRGDRYCGGYIAWVNEPYSGTVAKHQLVAGGPGDEAALTIHPSLLCRTCGSHGWIRTGRWEPA